MKSFTCIFKYLLFHRYRTNLVVSINIGFEIGVYLLNKYIRNSKDAKAAILEKDITPARILKSMKIFIVWPLAAILQSICLKKSTFSVPNHTVI